MLRRLWLMFAQATTIGLAALFIVATLRPEWLRGTPAVVSTPVSGGVAILDNPRRVLITTADTTHTFTVTGATPTGSVISEVVGPITTSAATAQDFKTVTSVTINGAATAAVTVGTNAIASTATTKKTCPHCWTIAFMVRK